MARLSRAKREELFNQELARLNSGKDGVSLDALSELAEQVGRIRVTCRRGQVDLTGSMSSYLSLMEMLAEQRGKSKNPPSVQVEFVG
jgi:hypothetical protein